MPIAIKDISEKLTALIEPSEGVYVAMDYAEQYMEEFDLFSKSPNRASHKPYVLEIHKRNTKEKVRELFS